MRVLLCPVRCAVHVKVAVADLACACPGLSGGVLVAVFGQPCIYEIFMNSWVFRPALRRAQQAPKPCPEINVAGFVRQAYGRAALVMLMPSCRSGAPNYVLHHPK